MKTQSTSKRIYKMRKMQHCIFLFIVMLSFTSCRPTFDKNTDNSNKVNTDSLRLSESQNAVLDTTVRFLLDVAAKDFYEHQHPVPAGFRNVQLRNLAGTNAENHYLLCGQFLIKDKQEKDEWKYFATIKTSGYEQWIGKESINYCQDSKDVPYKSNDLSSGLKVRLDSLINLRQLNR